MRSFLIALIWLAVGFGFTEVVAELLQTANGVGRPPAEAWVPPPDNGGRPNYRPRPLAAVPPGEFVASSAY